MCPSIKSLPVAPRGYWIEHYSVTVQMPSAPGAALEILTRRVLRAERSLSQWHHTFRRVGNGNLVFDRTLFGEGTLEATRVGGLKLPTADRDGDITRMVVDFGRTLHPGDRVEFSIREKCTPDWDQLVRPNMRDRYAVVPEMTMAHVDIRVVFPRAQQPLSVWYLTDVHDWLGCGEPTGDRLLFLGATGQVSRQWRYPTVGLATGIAWAW